MKRANYAKYALRTQYTRSDSPGGLVRGKYAARFALTSNIAVIEPDLAAAFPNGAAVNDVFQTILASSKARSNSSATRHSNG